MFIDGDWLPGPGRPEVGQLRADDAVLVARMREGDAEAARLFVRQYRPDVYRYVFALVDGVEEAEDLTQQTLVQAYQHLHRFDHRRGSLRTWLHAIARAEVRAWRQARRTAAPLEETIGIADSRAAASLEAVEVRETLRRLPAKLREVVLLYYLEDYTVGEVAAMIDRPEGTVKRWLSAARKRLRHEWGGETRAHGSLLRLVCQLRVRSSRLRAPNPRPDES